MKYEMELRFRPGPTQSVCDRHDQISDYLCKLHKDWKVADLPKAEEPIPGGSEYFNLKKYTPKSLGGDLRYSSRESLKDHKSSDDYLIYEFSSNYNGIDIIDIDFIEDMISILSPYYMYIGDSEFTHIDKNIRRKLNLRNDFCRFFPVTYIDEILCKRRFGLDAKSFFDKYKNTIDSIYSVNNGILFMAPNIFVDIDTAESFNEEVWNRLS